MSDHYAMGGSTNGSDAGEDIDCLDHPAPKVLGAYSQLANRLRAVGPGLRPAPRMGRGGVRRLAGQGRPVRRRPATASGSPPILVIGTTRDPATPYAWSVSLAAELSKGDLLTVEGSDHVSYFYSACVRADVQTYLLDLATPPVGATCDD